MEETEQDYAKKSFDDVAHKYDEIPFFKTSARHVVEIIKREKGEDNALNILDVACGTGNVVLECAVCMPNAKFMAVDISEGMLAKARANAEAKIMKLEDQPEKKATSVSSEEDRAAKALTSLKAALANRVQRSANPRWWHKWL
jgi:release factor glutamine methyltransferase